MALSGVLLSACGADVSFVYDRTQYQTNQFTENFYDDETLSTIFASENLSYTTNWSFPESQIRQAIPATEPNDPYGDQFALNHKLARAMPSLAYGFESKLFDGILYCTDAERISKSRLQLLPSGMGYRFPKVLDTYSTLGLFMKAGADTDQGGKKITALNVAFSFYRPSIFGYEQMTMHLEIVNLVQSNFPGYYEITLPASILKGIVGFSFTYTIVTPIISEAMEHLTGVFLYEVLLPGATWQNA